MADSIYVNSPTAEAEGDAVYESCALQEMPSTSVRPTSEKPDSPPKKIREDPVPTVVSSKHVVLMCGAIVFTMLGVIAALVFCAVSQARLQADLRRINITVSEARQTTHEEMLERSTRDIADLKKSLRDARAGIMQEIADMNEHLRDFEIMTGYGFLQINESLNHINMSTADKIADMNEHLRDFENMTGYGFLRINESLNHTNMRTADNFLRINESLNHTNMRTADRFLRINESLNHINMSTATEIARLNANQRLLENLTANDISDLNKTVCYFQSIIYQDIANNTEQIEGLKRFTNIMPRNFWDIKQRLNGIEAKTDTIQVNEVGHNMMSERAVVSSCESAGCHTVTPTYELPDKYIDELIKRSSSCRQFIKVKCHGVRINSGDHFTYWISRTGEKMYNWGTDRPNYCQCGLNDTCISNSYQCNCDQNDNDVTTSDEGYLTDKSKLPLREIRIGDMGESHENAWLTIGKLECVGLTQVNESLNDIVLATANEIKGLKYRMRDTESSISLIKRRGVVEVHHDITYEVNIHSTTAYSVTPTYEITNESLTELLQKSSSCRQYIRIRCRGVKINRGSQTYWVSRDRREMSNWGTDRLGHCPCGINDTCIDNRYQCNCDRFDFATITSDGGYLTDKSKLPLYQIRIEGMRLDSAAWLTIGNLECFTLDLEYRVKVRLSSGNDSRGRVEIQYDNLWGTICGDGWGWNESNVICKMLGFRYAHSFYTHGSGRGKIWMDDVSCTGNESTIVACKKSALGLHNCTHDNDIGVICRNVVSTRLVDGNHTSGRVELFLNGEWGSVCNDDWDLAEANVVCHMLGIGNASAAVSVVGSNGSISLDSVSCVGKEISILECTHEPIGGHNCSDERRAGVVCNPIVRLSSGTNSSGRVEIFHDGEWGTICDDHWDIRDGRVICRMLGFSDVETAGQSYQYYGTGQIWLDDVHCSGSEISILDCHKQPWGNNNCGHNEDASVYCTEN